jgi:acetyltransferase EpsM
MATSIKLIIWGAGGHALVVCDLLRCHGGVEIVGFLDDANPGRQGQAFCGATILGGREVLPKLRERGVTHAILAFGDNAARLRLADAVRQAGLGLAPATVHPRATVAEGVAIGAGSMVFAGAVVNAAARIGENVIINTSASIDHECVIEDGAHLSPGARLGGRVKVGRGAWMAIGAVAAPGISIGEGSIVGAGAVVLEDIPAGVVAFGVPARVQRRATKDK